jgi:hypothetical protein
LLAKGDIDIGLTFISTEPGVEVVGPLRRDISTPAALVPARERPRYARGTPRVSHHKTR